MSKSLVLSLIALSSFNGAAIANEPEKSTHVAAAVCAFINEFRTLKPLTITSKLNTWPSYKENVKDDLNSISIYENTDGQYSFVGQLQYRDGQIIEATSWGKESPNHISNHFSDLNPHMRMKKVEGDAQTIAALFDICKHTCVIKQPSADRAKISCDNGHKVYDLIGGISFVNPPKPEEHAATPSVTVTRNGGTLTATNNEKSPISLDFDWSSLS